MVTKDEKRLAVEEWMKDLSEEERAFLEERGVGNYEDMKNAEWKHIEKLTPSKRMEHYGWLMNTISNSTNSEEKELALKWWRKLYSSFLQSKEWKAFRMKYLMHNPKCSIPTCKNISEVPDHYPIKAFKLFIEKGFLEPLKDYNNFRPLCRDCHTRLEGFKVDK